MEKMIDKISKDYPAVSIANLEWSYAQSSAGSASDNTEQSDDTENQQKATGSRIDKLSLSLEIFMCDK